MEYNFNYKLKFQVPQPSSAPPKSGVRVRCPSGAHAVHVWLACGARVVPIWCARGACLVRPWCARSARLARPWCSSGPLAVRVWLVHSAHAVCVWLAYGLLTWLLEFEPPNLQDFPAFLLGFHGCKAYP